MFFSFATKIFRQDPDPQSIGFLDTYLSVIQDYGSPDPKEIFTDAQHGGFSL
jgi:hypothetical protein